MNLSLELTAEETAMLEKCAVRNNISTAEFIKNTIRHVAPPCCVLLKLNYNK